MEKYLLTPRAFQHQSKFTNIKQKGEILATNWVFPKLKLLYKLQNEVKQTHFSKILRLPYDFTGLYL